MRCLIVYFLEIFIDYYSKLLIIIANYEKNFLFIKSDFLYMSQYTISSMI